MVRYLAKFERWSFGVHYLHLKNVGSILLIIQHEITPLFLLIFDIKKHLFLINTFQIARKNLRGDADISHRCASSRVAAKSTTPNNFQKLAGLVMPTAGKRTVSKIQLDPHLAISQWWSPILGFSSPCCVLTKAVHTSPSQASYWVYFVSILGNDFF